jgi:hypothetical protein
MESCVVAVHVFSYTFVGWQATMQWSVALRQRLSDGNFKRNWALLGKEDFGNTGKDWAITDDIINAKLLVMWWRTWHLKSNIFFLLVCCSFSHIWLASVLQVADAKG